MSNQPTNEQEQKLLELKQVVKAIIDKNPLFRQYLQGIVLAETYRVGQAAEETTFRAGQQQLAKEILLLGDAWK